MAAKVEAILALRGAKNISVGRERIHMLETVAKEGSITKAAQTLGFSYKYAWDAISAINNLLPRPAIVTQSGGRKGGGAMLTEDGRRLIEAFHRLEEKLARITQVLTEEGPDEHPDLLFWSVAMKTSARNAFHCVVKEVNEAAVNVKVTLTVTDETTITAVITKDSAQELAIAPGREAVALVKSSFVMLAKAEEKVNLSSRNRIYGTVARRVDGGVNSEISVDIGGGKRLTSVITKEAADDLCLEPGTKVMAFFKSSHVILAVD